MNSRRTLTYFHSGSLDSVRAPHTRMPRPGKRRMALTPLGLRTSCVAVVDLVLEVDGAGHHLVGRRLPHAAGVVGEGVDAADRAAGGIFLRAPLRGSLMKIHG